MSDHPCIDARQLTSAVKLRRGAFGFPTRRRIMRLFVPAGRTALAFLLLTVGFSAMAQETTPIKDRLVGVWRFVSSTSQRDDGSNTWGANAKGQLIFTANGRFSFQLMRSDRPKYKSNTRMRGSLIENQATTRGTLSYFGTYAVGETDQTLTYNIESSSFPNFNDTSQKRVMTLLGDELRYQIPAPSRGTTPTTMVWTRLK